MIRQTIHGFYAEKMYPSLEMIYKKLQECEHIPDFKLTTLKTWCKKLNFSPKKFSKKSVWIESVSIAAQRDTYLRKITDYRKNDYNIFYTGETCYDTNYSKKSGWIATIDFNLEGVQSNCNEKKEISSSGSGKVIILDIGGVEGFVPGCRLFFTEKKDADNKEVKVEDYIWNGFKKYCKYYRISL
ncbi:Protein of unknown function [Cotesia congregata]|uniref:Uncharacterized protein n=1 Tax=Cotesia congregata TaxID=51543 RepID=A0A8J2HIC5_COTCN|nr:Protein of unknown function [Cotesia congregata]